MHEKHLKAYMATAENFAKCSTAKKLQVGAIVVKDNRIISIGYNGTPTGWSNECEDEFLYEDGGSELKTKPEVIHAESNAITKIAASNESSKDAIMFCTHTPCIDCAKLIYQSGITSVYIRDNYSPSKGSGVDFLKQCGVSIGWVNT